MVLGIHHVTDIFIALVRLVIDWKNKVYFASFFALVMLSWIYFRLYAFLYVIITIFQMEIVIRGMEQDLVDTLKLAFAVLLCFLYVLHWYWLYGFCRIIYGMVFKREFEDKVSPIEKKKK